MEMSVIAENLRVARAKNNYSQKDLAKRSGVCETTICFLENGKQGSIRMSTLSKLAKALNVEIETLLKN